MRSHNLSLFCCCLLFLLPFSFCISESDLFPFGNGNGPDESDAFVTDGTAFLQLDVPIVLYGEKHLTAHVSQKGIVTFGADPVPGVENRPFPLPYAAIAPFYADIETEETGFVQFRQSKKADLLDKANNLIHQLFPDQSSFQAKALFIATWSDVLGHGMPNEWNNTFQLVVANSGEDSFAFFLYPRIVWAQTKSRTPTEADISAQAGFMAADGRKVLLEGSGTDYLRALPTNKMPEEGQAQEGMYVYHIGHPAVTATGPERHEGENTGQEHDYSQYEETDAGDRSRPPTREPVDDRHPLDPANLRTAAPHTDVDVPAPEDAHDIDHTGHEGHVDQRPTAESPSTYASPPSPSPTPRDFRLQGNSVCHDASACHARAQCRQFPMGSCCECQEGFLGNGKLCFDKETPQRMNGQASGQLNGIDFRDALMHNYVIINEGRVYVAYSPINSEIGHALQSVLTMSTIVGWIFAQPENGVPNGLMLTGGVFNHTATVKFPGTGQTVHVSQHFSGLDEHNMLHSTLFLSGTTPAATAGQTFEFADHNIEYRRVSPGLIQSYSSHSVQIGEQSHRYTVEESISYFECPHNDQLAAFRTSRLQVQGVVSLYQAQEKASRFGMNAKITLYGQAGQDICQNIDCGQYAGCVLQEGRAQCVCRAGFQVAPGTDVTVQPLNCIDVDECSTRNECSTNAQCVNTEGSFQCQCLAGYSGDGNVCKTTEETMGHGEGCSSCDANADCAMDSANRQVCRCRQGYEGDGYRCALAQTAGGDCVAQPELCDPNARCQPNQRGQYECTCSTGYVGDGRTCQLQSGGGVRPTPGEDTCYHHPEQCGKNAACIPAGSRGYQCQCLSGFEGDGKSCRALVVTRGGFLVFTQGMSVMKLPVDRNSPDRGGQIAILPSQTAVGIAVDCADSSIYWSDIAGHSINKARYDGTGIEPVLRNIMSAEGIAVDPVSRNIFWTDSGTDHIAVAKLTDVKSGYKVIISKNLSNPRAIAIHPSRGSIFWTDWNRESPKIETANMDGSERRVLIQKEIQLPNALTVDVITDDICWADAGNQKVECASIDGNNRRMIYFGASYPFSMTVYQDTLYWTDWANNNIISVSKRGGPEKHTHDLPIGSSGKVYGIAAVPEQCPAIQNACAGGNGGCRFICLPLQNGQRKCACPDNLSDAECGEDPVYRN